MLSFICEDDIITIESINRIAKNTKDLLTVVETINGKNAEFISKKKSLDTRTSTGKFMLTVFGAMAKPEREYILSLQAEWITVAKEQGKFKGKLKMTIDENAFKRKY